MRPQTSQPFWVGPSCLTVITGWGGEANGKEVWAVRGGVASLALASAGASGKPARRETIRRGPWGGLERQDLPGGLLVHGQSLLI